MPALAFYIDAPMQSWGAASKFQYRETNPFPTKSALVGLIASALGIDKHQPNEAQTADGTFYQSDQPVAFGQHHGAVPAAYRARGIRQHRPS